MKLKIKKSFSVKGTFVVRDENGELLAREVSPEFAAWIVAKAGTRKMVSKDGSARWEKDTDYGAPLTEDAEIEI